MFLTSFRRVCFFTRLIVLIFLYVVLISAVATWPVCDPLLLFLESFYFLKLWSLEFYKNPFSNPCVLTNALIMQAMWFYIDCGLLGCGPVCSFRSLPTFQRNVSLHDSSMKPCFLPKTYIYTQDHMTSQTEGHKPCLRRKNSKSQICDSVHNSINLFFADDLNTHRSIGDADRYEDCFWSPILILYKLYHWIT